MSRHDASRLADVIESIEAIRSHIGKGDLNEGLVYDADHAVVHDVVDNELDPPLSAVRSLSGRIEQRTDES